jgi:hypothetical protein
MNTQTLNRMIKASYYAPNGAQLRKACYGVMAVNSRKASVGAMSVEDLAELPKEEQAQVKGDIIKEALIETSAESQAKLSSVGLKDVAKFVQANHITADKVLSTTNNSDPELKQAIESEIHTVKDGIALASSVVKARSFQEILSFLDLPISYVQTTYENINWFKYEVICNCIGAFVTIVGIAGPAVGLGIGGSILAALIGVGIEIGMAAIIYYLFGNIIDWLNKWQARFYMWITLFPLRLISLVLKSFGWVLDQFTSGIKSALGFFNRQASIAMQSPEFRRAYYNI